MLPAMEQTTNPIYTDSSGSIEGLSKSHAHKSHSDIINTSQIHTSCPSANSDNTFLSSSSRRPSALNHSLHAGANADTITHTCWETAYVFPY